MTLALSVVPKSADARYSDATRRQANLVRRAITSAANEIAREIQRRGRQEIRAGGDFSVRAARGLKAYKLRKRAGSKMTVVRVNMNRFLRTFEFGAVIKGKPLLWIPLSFAEDAPHVRARKYPKPLFRIDSKRGTPLLITRGGEPKYFGIEQVTEPKLFDVREVTREVADRTAEYYSAYLAKRV